ncbi:transcription initiation factor TFIIF subunit beta, partial [Phenoliferia sp. Uapishka_3]
MSFPLNTLPAEFEEAHGSVDLGADEKPSLGDDGGEDEDLDINGLQQRVWLVKVPRFLMEKWNETQQEGVVLGRVRVYDEKDSNGDQKISVLLDEDSKPSVPTASSSHLKPDIRRAPTATTSTGRSVPLEYKLTLQNTATKNMYVFGEKEEEVKETGEEGHRKRRRITSVLGTVHHECSLTPLLSSLDASSSYRNIMRDRQRKASEPKRTIKMLDVDQGTANRLAAGQGLPGIKGRVSSFVKVKPSGASTNLRAARIPRNELLDVLFSLFEDKPYWQIKALTEHVQQPQVYLKEVLKEIAHQVEKGPYAGMWTLQAEYKGKGKEVKKGEDEDEKAPKAEGGDVKPKAEELESESESDSDDDMVEVQG